jgi:hypothetical protein
MHIGESLAYLGQQTDELVVQEMAEKRDGWRYGWKEAAKLLEAAKADRWDKTGPLASFQWEDMIDYPWWAYRYAMDVIKKIPPAKRQDPTIQRELRQIEEKISGRDGTIGGTRGVGKDLKGKPNPRPGIAYLYAKNFIGGKWEPGEQTLKMGAEVGQPEWLQKYGVLKTTGPEKVPEKTTPVPITEPDLQESTQEIAKGTSILPYILGAAAIGGVIWYFTSDSEPGDEDF